MTRICLPSTITEPARHGGEHLNAFDVHLGRANEHFLARRAFPSETLEPVRGFPDRHLEQLCTP